MPVGEAAGTLEMFAAAKPGEAPGQSSRRNAVEEGRRSSLLPGRAALVSSAALAQRWSCCPSRSAWERALHPTIAATRATRD